VIKVTYYYLAHVVESKPCQNNIVLSDVRMTLWGEPWATAMNKVEQ